MTEESAEGQMDTDVSSTTADVPESQEVTGSNGNVDMLIVVEQIKNEKSVNSNMQSSNQSPKKKDVPATSSENPTPTAEKPAQEPPDKSLVENVTPKSSPLKDSLPEKIVIKLPAKPDVSRKPVIIIKSNQLTKPNIKLATKESPDSSSKLLKPDETNIQQEKNVKNVALEKPEQKSPAKEVASEKSGSTPVTCPSVSEKSIVENNKDDEDSEISKQGNISETQIPMEIATDIEASNDSQMEVNSDTSEKEHNKSISRELKSLIKSAKESKIISECTQLTSKTRKSRAGLDSANTSLNATIEADKIQGTRRGSDNSQKSNCSEQSDKTALKRSMRSQNPEFVTKVKQFLNSVTGRAQKPDSDQIISNDELDESIKNESLNNSLLLTPKKKANEEKVSEEGSGRLNIDQYCWRCHWTVDIASNEKAHPPISCTVCPRSFHHKCLSGTERLKVNNEKSWVCPECLTILQAESSETRSIAMKKISLGMLCELLSHVLDRMMELNGVEPFTQPVDRTAFPDYDKYVVHPMDLSVIRTNLKEKLYGSTEAFAADVQWILHNSIIFNTLQSKLTAGARALVRACRAELGEVEACPECYAAAHTHRPTWFVDVCSMPHILLWAKLKGFPYWPAKGMSVNSSGLVDVRFFGAHDRAWVPAKDCFLYSEKDPNNFRTKRQDIIDSMEEAEHHIRNISRKYGRFVYPPFKTSFDPTKLSEQLKIMIPAFEGEVREPLKIVSPVRAKSKSRSNSKSSKEANEGYTSESDDVPKSRKMADGAVIARMEDDSSNAEKDKTMEVEILNQTVNSESGTANVTQDTPSRKRRRSDLQEAIITIIEPSVYEKRKKTEQTDKSKTDKLASDVASTSSEAADKKLGKDKTIIQTEKPDGKKSELTTNVKEKTKNDPNTSKDKNNTPTKVIPNIVFKVAGKTSTPKDKVRPAKRPASREKSSSSDKDKSGEDDNSKSKPSRPRPNRSLNTSAQKEVQVKTNNAANKSTSKEKPGSSKEDLSKSGNSKPSGSKGQNNKSNKFDDDTSLALIAREVAKNTVVNNSVPGFPTISSVRSLSVPDRSKTIEVTVDPEPVTVGRLGVRAFARMTSPSAPEQVEIKAEPPDAEDDQAEKIQMMNAFQLQPTNAKKKTVVEKAKARKSFPTPRRVEEGRSELNSKNSMVYIPIQPPATQPPTRPQKPNNANNNGPNNMSLLVPRQNAPVVSSSTRNISDISNSNPIKVVSGNNQVNTVTTPLLQFPGSSIIQGQSGTILGPGNPGSILGPGSPGSILGPGSPGSILGIGNPGPMLGHGQHETILGHGMPGTMISGGQSTSTSVHTVPLITSVNGQWTFSLQPIMSVGVDPTDPPPLTNGILERQGTLLTQANAIPGTVGNIGAIPSGLSHSNQSSPALSQSDAMPSLPLAGTVPPSMSISTVVSSSQGQPSSVASSITITPLPKTSTAVTTTDSSNVTTASTAPGEPPGLTRRPQITTPLDADIPIGCIPPPSDAGPVTAKLNHNAVKLADFFRTLLEDTIEKVDAPQAQVTLLTKEIETLKWKHMQEIHELKHTQELMRAEMRSSFEKEKVRTVAELRRAAQIELDAAVRRTKAKQWCANCSQEAQFYCCWNTSYCDLSCQRAHWPTHYTTCSQQRPEGGAAEGSPPNRLQPHPDNASNTNTPALTQGGKVSQPRVLQTDQPNKGSIIVSMVDDPAGGNQTVKCVGTYKPTPAQSSSLIINKQIMNNEENVKKMTSGGYLIVGGANASLVGQPRRNNATFF